MVAFAFWIGLGGWVLNFDIGYTGLLLRMPPFNKSFGHCALVPVKGGPAGATTLLCELSATQQSLTASIYLLFMALGAGAAGVTGSYLGRRGTIQVGCAFIIVGAAGMLGSAGNLVAHIACKCIGAVGIGHLQSAAPTWGVEATPAKRRGLLVTLYSVGAGFGTFVVGLICLRSSKVTNDWSWKTPIICQIPVALIYGCGVMVFPESPRWLLTKGRDEEARRSFGKLYAKHPESEEINTLANGVRAAIQFEQSISSTRSWTEIFHRSAIRRTMIATAIVIGAPLGGTFFIFTYAAVFLSSVGIHNPFVITVVINTCTFAGVCLGPLFVEYLGRRRTILTGYGGTATCMLIFAVVSTALGQSSQAAKNTVITFLCLWAFIFGGCIASSMWVTSAEMHSIRLRGPAQAFTTLMSNTFVFATNFWTPYMINPHNGNMGTNVGYFYFGVQTVTAIILFFIVPETARLSLEQLDRYFTSGQKAWRTSLAQNKRLASQD